MTTIYIVTPCLNAVQTIDRTIHSVLSQAGSFRIRYHVKDGGSDDGTLERLAHWQDLVDTGVFPLECAGMSFSWESQPDKSMYDGIVQGFDALTVPHNGFMTWINADDILTSGSCAFIAAVADQFPGEHASWVSGAVAILRNDMIVASYDRTLPRAALSGGLCDGRHWPVLQQEGTYFRKWLWDTAEPAKNIAPMRLAGDWNLWRLFAAHADPVQASVPLGAFRLGGENQLSTRHHAAYQAEIEACIPVAKRRDLLRSLVEGGDITRQTIRGEYSDSILKIFEHSALPQGLACYREVFEQDPPATGPAREETLLHTGQPGHAPRSAPAELRGHAQHADGYSILDAGWQVPAITELHAARRIQPFATGQAEVQYVAFPWASLIDKLQCNTPDSDAWLQAFREFCTDLPRGRRRVTVCQHIFARRYRSLFREAGIQDVFWPHAGLAEIEGQGHVNFHPFPLYPVEIPDQPADDAKRAHLFSFVGARADNHYLTDARNIIIRELSDHPRGHVIARDAWHYQNAVYDQQIYGKHDLAEMSPERMQAFTDRTASEEFRDALRNSLFALCPSGSGPNSIRLWESIGAGAIPVILSENWVPPGDRALWENAALFCKETPAAIRHLPDRLAILAADPDRLARMRHALRQLWLLYGPDTFVTDIQGFILAAAGTSATPPPPVLSVPGDTTLSERQELQEHASVLLSKGPGLRGLIDDPMLDSAVSRARAAFSRDVGLLAHVDAVLARARAQAARYPQAPAPLRGAAPKIHLAGAQTAFCPLAHASVRAMIGERIAWTDTPEAADLVILGSRKDLRAQSEALQPLVTRPNGPSIAVMSSRPQRAERDGDLPHSLFCPGNSDIFAFRKLPFEVVHDDRSAVRLANLLAFWAAHSAEDMLQNWRNASLSTVLFADEGAGADPAPAPRGVHPVWLTKYRRAVARHVRGKDVLRLGERQIDDTPAPERQLDRLARFSGRVRLLATYEAVSQPDCVSPTLFEAFAIGAVPVCWAAQNHRVFDMVPAAAMLNTHGVDAADAARKITGCAPDRDMARAWLTGCAELARLVGDPQILWAERRYLAHACETAIAGVTGGRRRGARKPDRDTVR
jgi:hypothetical protein